MGIPPVYRKTPERAIVSFDFKDLASGSGFEEFFLAKNNDDSGTTDVLTTTPIWSSLVETNFGEGAEVTTNFDSTVFNLPRTIRGTAILNLGIVSSSSGNQETIKVQLFKWDGSTETALTAELTLTPLTFIGVAAFSLPLTDSTGSLIKTGEQIRLKIIISAIQAAEFIALGHDPRDRDSDVISGAATITSSRIFIPFKIDL